VPPEHGAALAELARLRADIAEARAAMRERAAEAAGVLAAWAEAVVPDRVQLLIAAVAMHAWYTALERIFERVARQLDRAMPTGDRSHVDLLSQATTEVPGLRPALVPRGLHADLATLLGFRHFFRHAYALALDPAKLRPDLERLLRLEPEVSRALDAFDAFLDAAAASLGG
jgi:hypothetical protein